MFLIHRKREGEDLRWGINWRAKENKKDRNIFQLTFLFPISFPKFMEHEDFFTRSRMYGKRIKAMWILFWLHKPRYDGKVFCFDSETGYCDFCEQQTLTKEGAKVLDGGKTGG